MFKHFKNILVGLVLAIGKWNLHCTDDFFSPSILQVAETSKRGRVKFSYKLYKNSHGGIVLGDDMLVYLLYSLPLYSILFF